MQKIGVAALLTLCLVVTTATIRAAWADLEYARNTPDALDRAVSLAPDNVIFRALRAEHKETAGVSPIPDLTENTRLSTLDSAPLIRLAFQREIEGQYAEAERLLVRASQVDRKGEPRLALMNFYFRRGQDTEFWLWVKRSLEFRQPDVTWVYRLAWDRSDDAGLILSQIPSNTILLRSYFAFLYRTKRWDALDEVAKRLAASGDRESLSNLTDYCHRYAGTEGSRVLSVWNSLANAKLIPYRPLDPKSGEIVTNGDFSIESSGRAFDWRLRNVEGAIVTQEDGGLQVEFNGNQRDQANLLEQPVVLDPGRKYLITWQGRPRGSDATPGMYWELDGAEFPITAGSASLTARKSNAWLRLGYRRTLGTVPAKGIFVLKSVRGAVLP